MAAMIVRRLAGWWLPALVVAGAWLLFAGLMVQVSGRVVYPWDLLNWSESPFMTNMVKLHRGEPIFSAPEDGNSFVYSPGLEWITYGLLRPIGRDLDIRWCRGVSAGVGLAAAVVTALFAWRVLQTLARNRSARWTIALMIPVAALVFFRNATADVCHPDNLHGLHLAGSCLLAAWALRTRRMSVACIAILFGATGVLAKQTAALGGMAVALSLTAAWYGRREKLLLVGVGILSTCAVLAFLLQSPDARFWLFALLRQHPFHNEKLLEVPARLDAVRGILYFLAALGVADALCRRGRQTRELGWLWITMGMEALPGLLAYGKEMGSLNNLGVIDLWAAGMALPAMLALRPPRVARAVTARVGEPGLVGVVLLVGLLLPQRIAVQPAMYRYGARLDRMVALDVKRDRNVLLAHGTMPLLRAGCREVPRDRANSILELRTGNAYDDRVFLSRLAEARYDRIYLNSDWYGTPIERAIGRYYRLAETLRPAVPHSNVPLYKRLLGEVRVYEPRPAARRLAARPQPTGRECPLR